MAILSFNFTIDTDTLEISVSDAEMTKSRSLPLKKDKKTSDEEESTEPILTLYNTKYELNNAAMEVLGVKPGDRLMICFDKEGKPLIGRQEVFGDESGNKISNSNTVSFRGSGNTELAKFGSKFTLVKKDYGIFYLTNDSMGKPLELDENIQIPVDGGASDVPDVDIESLFAGFDFDESKYDVSATDFSF